MQRFYYSCILHVYSVTTDDQKQKVMFDLNKNIYILCIVIIGILFTNISCDDNTRSLRNFGIDIATVVPQGYNSYYLHLDNGVKLWPASTDIEYMPKENQRVFLNYTILSEEKDGFDHYIKVNDVWDILTKQIVRLNSQNEDMLGNDPIKTNAVWVGGDYLNVSFMFNYDGERPHAINLASISSYSDSSQLGAELTLRHNSYNSGSSKLYEGFVCFDLKPLRVNDADSVHISIKINEWVDLPGNDIKEKTYDVIYRYGNSDLANRTEMPIPVISSKEYY